jgi:outer membrane protein assembly factor BamD (BamD/ComL family)
MSYIIYVSVKKELAMFAVVDFDRKETHFFNSFQEASDFITQYPVIETVVVVDMSDEGPMCELL